MVKIKSYAKINLTLDIVGQKEGFHLLDSFVASIDLFNLVVVQKRKDKLVSGRFKGLEMDSVPFEKTNACKVAEKFVEKFSVQNDIFVPNKEVGGLFTLWKFSEKTLGQNAILLANREVEGFFFKR